MNAPGDGPAAAAARWAAPFQFAIALGLMWFVPGIAGALMQNAGWLRDGLPELDRSALQMLAFAVGCAAVAAFAQLSRPPVPWRPVRALPTVLVYAPVALLWLLLTVGYLQAAHRLGHPIPPQGPLQQVAAMGPHDVRTLAFVLTIVLAAPLAEELVFRGYLLGACMLALPSLPAQLLTAAAFGLVHGLDYALPMTLLGGLFGWLRLRHRSLWPSMLAHVLHNALTMAVALWWPSLIDSMYPR